MMQLAGLYLNIEPKTHEYDVFNSACLNQELLERDWEKPRA